MSSVRDRVQWIVCRRIMMASKQLENVRVDCIEQGVEL